MSSPVLVLQFGAESPLARLGEWLAAAGLDLDVRDVAAGEPVPADLDGWGGLVALGGPVGAFEDARAPFLPAVRALLREVVNAQVPTLALGLGAQLLAVAHGGRVAPCATGPELGACLVAKRQAAFTDPLFGPMPITPDVVAWHHDEITALPPGALHLAASAQCEYHAFRLGRLAWGLQFHIETTGPIVRAWAEADAEALAGRDRDELFAAVAEAHEFMAEVWPPFATAWAGAVREPDGVPEPPSVRSSAARPVTDAAAIRAALAAEANAARGVSSLPMPGRRPPQDR